MMPDGAWKVGLLLPPDIPVTLFSSVRFKLFCFCCFVSFRKCSDTGPFISTIFCLKYRIIETSPGAPEGGMGMSSPKDPLFAPHTSQGSPFEQPVVNKGHISSNCQFTRPPSEKKWKILASTSYNPNSVKNFRSQEAQIWNFSVHKTPNLEILSSQDPQIWKFLVHKTPNLQIFSSQDPHFRGNDQLTSPTLRKSGPQKKKIWKKVECPPPGSKANY